MRLFNRRKEMEFDDPRLVGMAPLQATEESCEREGRTPQRQNQRPRSSSGGRGSRTNGMTTLPEEERPFGKEIPTLKRVQIQEPPDKCKMTNGKSFIIHKNGPLICLKGEFNLILFYPTV